MDDGWMDGWMPFLPSVLPEIIYRHVPAGTTGRFPIFNFNDSLDTYANVRGHTNKLKKNSSLFASFLSSLRGGGGGRGRVQSNLLSGSRGRRRILRYSAMH